MSNRMCELCQSAIPPDKNARTKYCSAPCRDRAWYQKRIFATREATCQHCGEVFTHQQTTRQQKYCSRSCAGESQRKPKKPKAPKTRIWINDCEACDTPFVCRNPKAKHCMSHRNRVQADRIMALYRLAMKRLHIKEACHWRWALVHHLAQRDGTACGICGNTIDVTLSSGPRGDDRGPTIDHVIPWSISHDDTLQNLRLAHWSCNRERGAARGETLQLRLSV